MSPLPLEDPTTVTTSKAIMKINNYINGQFKAPKTEQYMDVESPSTSETIAQVAISTKADVDEAVDAASKAFVSWSKLTVKSRATIMMKFHYLVKVHAHELAELIVKENGKNMTEALADVAKGNETVEYACSLPQLIQGKILRVSSEVTCEDRRNPLGVVASIVPFNFPFMVPMWTLPIALVSGNTVVLKPSEKVPLTMYKTMELWKEAGLPDGVVNLVQGTKEAVESIIDHPDVRAVTFVGSSPIASIVSSRCHKLNKRCTALGGAKNHLIALPDCNVEDTARDIVVSAAGCAGQRCMAASVLLMVGNGPTQKKLLEKVIENAQSIQPGTAPGQCGPVIDSNSYHKIVKYVTEAEAGGAEILLDGRKWSSVNGGQGNWVGPTIISHSSSDDAAIKEEIFGPVLSIFRVANWAEAIQIENKNPFGNAACIYTSNGGHADWFTRRFRAAMLGVNVGIPVPREPFSFGGLYGTRSKYGDMDITGDGAIEFFTNRIKVTSKWSIPNDLTVGDTNVIDHANFAGTM
mmetsp:Transcript_1498/g.1627  ORF Transcript_1498/g.1627 Transcript_1498/m.1627 type:complete len:522 (-) Transcript_1498:184-1749(-)